MLNLDLVGAINFQKGCYTGQEIVARTQHLGRIKRRLLRVRTRIAAPLGASVRLPDGRLGRLTELQASDDGYEGLAVAPLAAPDATGPADDAAADADGAGDAPIPAELLPLPYAL